MIPRELYIYHYGNNIVSGVVPSKKKGTTGKLVGSRNNDNNNDRVNNETTTNDENITLVTADGFLSNGGQSSGNKLKIKSKWNKRLGRSATELEHMLDPVRQRVFDDISQHCKALKNESGTLVDYREIQP